MKLNLKLLLTLFLASASVYAENLEKVENLEFVDFPLTKVDYMYREQGQPIAHLVFDLWVCTMDSLSHDLSLYSSDSSKLKIVKDEFYSKAYPVFIKLNTFKRFIDELSYEWGEKREIEGLQNLFRKMFSSRQGKIYIEKLSAQEFNQALKNIRFFLWDVASSAPYAKEKCFEKLTPSEQVLFKQFLSAEYMDLV